MERAGPRSRCTAPGMIPSPGGFRLAPESSSPVPKSTNKGDKMLEGGRAAWFRDSEGNLLAIGEAVR